MVFWFDCLAFYVARRVDGLTVLWAACVYNVDAGDRPTVVPDWKHVFIEDSANYSRNLDAFREAGQSHQGGETRGKRAKRGGSKTKALLVRDA